MTLWAIGIARGIEKPCFSNCSITVLLWAAKITLQDYIYEMRRKETNWHEDSKLFAAEEHACVLPDTSYSRTWVCSDNAKLEKCSTEKFYCLAILWVYIDELLSAYLGSQIQFEIFTKKNMLLCQGYRQYESVCSLICWQKQFVMIT